MYHAYSNPGVGWYTEDLTAETGAPPAALGSGLSAFADVSASNQDVFFVGTNQHLYQLFSNPGVAWYSADLTAITGAPVAAPGTGLSAFEDVAHGNQDLFYIAANQHVYQLFSDPGVTWYPVDLTTTIGAPAASPETSLSAFEDVEHGNQDVFYIAANQHVYQLFSNPGVTWYPVDLTATTDAPAAAPGSGLGAFADVSAGNQDVFYVGTDQHIHQLFSNPGVTWYTADLTAAASATPAASGTGLSAFADLSAGNQDVFYVGTDQHVHQLFSDPGVAWYPEDLTSIAGAVPATSGTGLSAFADPTYGNQDVFYVGTDQHVHQFFSNPGVTWYVGDVTGGAAANSALSSFAPGEGYVTISGQITAGGSGLPGVTVSLSGTISLAATTDSNGNYSFSVPAGGSYTVTPSDASGDTFTASASQPLTSVSANQTVNFAVVLDTTPDPPPSPYPNSVSSPPSAPAGSCNITGTWNDGAYVGTWSWTLVQTGNTLSGSFNGQPPAEYGCSATSWQVSGQINGNAASLTASNPSPSAQSCNPGYQYTAANPLTVTVSFSSCTAGSASEKFPSNAGNQFASGGGGTTSGSASGPWTLASSPLTFTLNSSAQVAVPGLANAYLIPISITDNPQLTTTASVSGYSFSVNYPAQFLGNPHSNCQASLSAPSASGATTATSNVSAPTGCGGIFSVSGSIGQSFTQNAVYVVAPPDILVRELWGEASGQTVVGDQFSELAIGNTIRQRFGDNQYFKGFNAYEDMAGNSDFTGLQRCPAGCLSGVQHAIETQNAAFIYGGVNTPATNVDDSKCFLSPTPADWQKISQALNSETTVFPQGLTVNPHCWNTPNRQIVYKTAVGNNAVYKSSATPAFLFEQWRDPSDPAVIQIQ